MFSFEQLWNKLEIRVLVISSLCLQIFLLVIAGFRKHVISVRWAKTTDFTPLGPLAFVFHLLLWLAYLLADYVATVALAYLRGSEIRKATQENKTNYLLVFWAPFFVLHLGGQDTITALSIEDNELWARHLLILISQVALAMYNYFSSNLHVSELWPPAVLMFSVAIFKYVERVVSLQRASMSALRSSMITKPDPGPNYAKFMQEYTSSNDAGLVAVITVENEKHKDKGDLESHKTNESKELKTLSYADVVCKAYEFFKTFKRLFVDLILSYKDREESQKYFETLKTDDAYNLVEIELSWMYEILHSKGSIIYSCKHYGWISRVTTLVIISVALYLFASSDHTGYRRFETSLTYVLLVGAVSLEIIAIIFMLLSFWTYASMKDCWFFKPFSKYLFCIMEKMRPQKKPRWSNRMAQYSLITYSLEDKPRRWKSIVKSLGLKDTWDHYRYTSCVKVNEDLKELVFRELKNKMNNIDDTASYRRFTEHRGQWALQRKGYYQEFGWSVEAEFDESILLWHIATHLLFHDFKMFKEKQKNEQKLNSASQTVLLGVSEPVLLPVSQSVKAPVLQTVLPGVSEPVLLPVSQSVTAPVSQTVLLGVSEPVLLPVSQSVMTLVSQTVLPAVSEPLLPPVSQSEQKNEPKLNSEPEISHDISNYMMFLLIVRPFMMPAGIGQIRFGGTCAEAKNFLQQQGHINMVDAVGKILEVNTDYDPALVKGDRSKSVLFKGCMLAHNLKKEFTSTENGKSVLDWNKMWRLISGVWAEMLCYAASKCSGQFHDKQLSKGGELLTVIWFLMAHMGMGEHYRIEEGHARAKLIVSK